uniref:Exostosin GT47 domain-containing protein n=1 Tax=Ananas comosus var. bracteatus TaxID=296719 RepID=A0A6V7PWJ9_ANACO|nr:unnamed protein product [Ananas comosus var. bracteatus]
MAPVALPLPLPLLLHGDLFVPSFLLLLPPLRTTLPLKTTPRALSDNPIATTTTSSNTSASSSSSSPPLRIYVYDLPRGTTGTGCRIRGAGATCSRRRWRSTRRCWRTATAPWTRRAPTCSSSPSTSPATSRPHGPPLAPPRPPPPLLRRPPPLLPLPLLEPLPRPRPPLRRLPRLRRLLPPHGGRRRRRRHPRFLKALHPPPDLRLPPPPPCQQAAHVVIPPYVSPDIALHLPRPRRRPPRHLGLLPRQDGGPPQEHQRPLLQQEGEDGDIGEVRGNPRFYLKRKRYAGYRAEIARSVFCLCPLGWAPWSPRLVEAVVLGCVPVVIADDIRLPFPEVVRWEEISLAVPERDVARLEAVLDHVAATNLSEIQRNLWDPAKRRALLFHRPMEEGDATWQAMRELRGMLGRSRRRRRPRGESGADTWRR